MIISIVYRVNSIRGTQFRIWAYKVLIDYLLKAYVVNNRFKRLESEVSQLSDIDFKKPINLATNEGVFYEGQVFDAYFCVRYY